MSLSLLNRMMKHVQFDDKTKLGQGNFGDVFLGTRSAYKGPVTSWPEIDVAVKRTKSPLRGQKEKQTFMSEIEVLSKLRHPACLSLIAFCMPGSGMYHVVTEKMDVGLDKIVDQATRGASPDGWDDTAKSIVALGVAAGLGYLHSKNIIHRDVKPGNILLDSKFHPRVSDFGFAKIIPPEEHIKMTTGIGTPVFMAPEILKGDDYSFPVDVYAYGMMLFVILTNSYPFPELKDYFFSEKIINGGRPTIPPYVSDYYRELIGACWDPSPAHRPTFAQIIEKADDLMIGTCDAREFDDYKCDILKLS
jgi:serine/threonine protein kinase